MTKRATVVGAGLAGLTSAIALAESDYTVTVLEREHAQASQLGLAITGNGLEALAAIGMREAVEKAGVSTRVGGILTQTGTPLMGRTETDAGEVVAIHASTVLGILTERAEELGVEIRNNTYVRSLDDLPEADLVIGADGLRSDVRSWIAPKVRPDYSGATSWFGVTSRQDNTPAEVMTWVARGTEVGMVPLDDDRAYWYISKIERQRSGSKAGDTAPLEEAAAIAADFHGPLAEHVATTDVAVRTPLFYLPTGLKSFTSTDTGTPVVLVGDAAHATVPSLVQGANQAFEDAATLRILLENAESEDESIETVLGAYDRARVERAQSIQRKSLSALRWMQANNRVTGVMRNTTLKLTPVLLAEVVTDWYGRWFSPNARR